MTVTLNPPTSGTTSGPFAHSIGDHWMVVGKLALSGSYATGGDAFDPSSIVNSVGVGTIDLVSIPPMPGYFFTYDYVNKKVQVWDTGASSGAVFSEFAAGAYSTALLADSIPVLIIGR